MATRWRNGDSLALRLRDEVDRLFRDFGFGLPEVSWPAEWMGERSFPALNVWEDAEKFYAEAEVPGLDLSDLEILVVGNELTLKGGRKPFEKEGVTYHRRERRTGEFTRLLRLPAPVDAEKVSAALKDGVLTLTMPKAETAKARRIQVKPVSSQAAGQ